MDNYNTCSFVITHSITNTVISRTPFYGTEPSTLPLLPQGAHENEGFHLKMLLSTKNVLSLMWNLVPNHSVRENAAEYWAAPFDWMHFLVHFLVHIFFFLLLFWSPLHFESYTYGCPSSTQVYFCIWRKGDGLEGGRFGAKQTARVSTLKVNITLCLNYTPSALQFSHTLALSPLSLIPANTPTSRPG